MKKSVEEFLTKRGWNHDESKNVWTDPSKKIQGWIKVLDTAWYHLDADITNKITEAKTLARGNSAEDLHEHLKDPSAK